MINSHISDVHAMHFQNINPDALNQCTSLILYGSSVVNANLHSSRMKVPSFEDYKERFLEEIKKTGIHNNKEYIVNEVFNPDSELYRNTCFELDDILNEINKDFYGNHSLYTEMPSDSCIICDLMDESNPVISEVLGVHAMDLFDKYTKHFTMSNDPQCVGEDYRDMLKTELSTDKLKDYILSIMD